MEKVVLGEIRRLTQLATKYETEFARLVMGHSQKVVVIERQLKEKELATLKSRDNELDVLFEKIYEDNALGKISDERFAKMSIKYEDEQKEISERIKELESELKSEKSKKCKFGYVYGFCKEIHKSKKTNSPYA